MNTSTVAHALKLDMNVFDLVELRQDIADVAAEDLISVVFFDDWRYSQCDVLSGEQYRQGGHTNMYQSKQQLQSFYGVPEES